MLLYPSIDEMMTLVENRYSLVIMTAKRAREISDDLNNEKYTPLVTVDSNKSVTIAATEIHKKKLTYRHTGE